MPPSDRNRPPTRRGVLTLASLSSIGALAGCTEIFDEEHTNGSEPSNDAEQGSAETDQGEQTTGCHDTKPPEVLNLNARHLDETIQLGFTLIADCEIDYVDITIGKNSKTIENPSLAADASDVEANLKGMIELEVSIERGNSYRPHIEVVDEDGNTTDFIGDKLYVSVEQRPILTPYYTWYDPSRWNQGFATMPELGEYTSDDTRVIQQHLNWLQQSKITTIAVSWWGPHGPGSSQSNTRMFEEGILDADWPSSLDFCILYEPRNGSYGGRLEMVDGAIDLNREDNRSTLKSDFEYFSAEYFNDSRYFTIDDRPVVYFWIAGALSGDVFGAFEEVFDAIPEEPYLIADLNLWQEPSLLGTEIAEVFDGVTDYIMFAPEDLRENNVPQRNAYLEALEETLQRWRIATKEAGLDFYPVVQPGFTEFGDSENRVHERDVDLFRATCETVRQQLQEGHEGMMVTSFNEWHEDSHIEPDVVHGRSYLDIVEEELASSDVDFNNRELMTLTFEFDETAQPSEVEGTADTRELGFACEQITIEDQDGSQREYDIGGESEPLIIDGIFAAEEGAVGTFRWLGGPAQKSIFGIDTPDINNPKTVSISGHGFIENTVTVTLSDLSDTVEIRDEHDQYLFELDSSDNR